MPRFVFAVAACLLGTALINPAKADPAIWTLTDEDTVINIIGTIHLLPEETDWRSEAITNAFESADQVCFELDVEARALEIFGLTYSLGVFDGGDRLTNYLDEDQEAELREMAAIFNVPFTSLNVMKPWFVGLTLEQYFYEHMGLGDGVEFSLYPDVREQGKEICEMETAQEQMDALSGLALEEQLELLFQKPEGLDNAEIEDVLAHTKAELNDLIAHWLAGDVSAIGDLIDEEAGSNANFHEALLVNRNKAWVPRIESLLDQEGGNILIAVGAAHLAGKDSVITLLRDKGYKITGP